MHILYTHHHHHYYFKSRKKFLLFFCTENAFVSGKVRQLYTCSRYIYLFFLADGKRWALLICVKNQAMAAIVYVSPPLLTTIWNSFKVNRFAFHKSSKTNIRTLYITMYLQLAHFKSPIIYMYKYAFTQMRRNFLLFIHPTVYVFPIQSKVQKPHEPMTNKSHMRHTAKWWFIPFVALFL